MKTILFIILFVIFIVSKPEPDLKLIGQVCGFLFLLNFFWELIDKDPNP